MASGLALSWPAMSGAEPCTCEGWTPAVGCGRSKCATVGGKRAERLRTQGPHQGGPARKHGTACPAAQPQPRNSSPMCQACKVASRMASGPHRLVNAGLAGLGDGGGGQHAQGAGQHGRLVRQDVAKDVACMGRRSQWARVLVGVVRGTWSCDRCLTDKMSPKMLPAWVHTAAT